MCDYTGKHFGAGYVDAACADGTLYDLDGDGPSSADSTPCPRCATPEWLNMAADDAESCGLSMSEPWCGAVMLEAALSVAERENPDATAQWKRANGAVTVTDWPDRSAVYARRARWDDTISATMVLWSPSEQPMTKP